jgi:CHAT domain-containing protein
MRSSRHIGLHAAFVALILGAPGIVTAQTGAAPPQRYNASPDERRELDGADTRRVAELERKARAKIEAGRLDEALPSVREIREIRARAQGERHWQAIDADVRLQTLTRLAARPPEERELWLASLKDEVACDDLGRTGRHDEAVRRLRQALEIRRRLLGEGHPDTAAVYHGLAKHLGELRRDAEAEPLFRRALLIRETILGRYHPATERSREDLAWNVLAQDPDKPIDYMLLHPEVIMLLSPRPGRPAALPRPGPGTRAAGPFPVLAAALARRGLRRRAFMAIETGLARELSMDLGIDRRPPQPPRPGTRQGVSLQVLDDRIAAVLTGSDGGFTPFEWLEKLESLRKDGRAENARIQAEMGRTRGPAGGEIYELGRIQASLPERTALVGWVELGPAGRIQSRSSEHWVCLVPSRGDPVWIPIPGAKGAPGFTEEDFRRTDDLTAILGNGPQRAGADWREQAARLGQRLLGPLAPHLEGRDGRPPIRHLVFLPSRYLGAMPIGPLLAAWKGAPAGLRVSYAPSATIFAWLQEGRRAARSRGRAALPTRLLALGDPAYGTSSGGGLVLAPLPGTRREVEAVAALFQQPTVLLGPDASIAELERRATQGDLGRYDILHLATHGRAGAVAHGGVVFLAEGATLNTAQLRSWKLDADLVVLSACQTGLGDHDATLGEGPGFAQALFLAGARTVVLSQWKVDDQATALLMTRFHANLLGRRAGLDHPMPKAEALDEARLWLADLTEEEIGRDPLAMARGEIRKLKGGGTASAGTGAPATVPKPGTRRPYEHPRYWAAFVLVGDPF